MNDLISIIIPVYNTDEIIYETIASIENNKYKNIEILIIDDGSNEKTKKILQSIKQQYKQYNNIEIFSKKNEGVSIARNYGIEKANGRYIMFVDSDDCIYDDSIEYLYNIIKKEKCNFVVGSPYSAEKNNFNKSENQIFTKHYLNNQVLEYFLINNNARWSVWGTIYDKKFLKNIRFPENVKIAEDMYFNYQAYFKAKNIIISDKFVYFYRINKNSVMNNNYNYNKIKDVIMMIKKVYSHNKDNDKYIYFYLNRMLWLFKECFNLKLTKDDKDKINYQRKQFVDEFNNNICNVGIRKKMEYKLLKHSCFLFSMYSKLYMKLFKLKHRIDKKIYKKI